MALVFDGSANTIGGLAVGGLPDGVVDNGCMADDAIAIADLAATGTASASTFLRGDNSWQAAGGGKLVAVSQGTYSTNSSTTSESYVDTGLAVTHQCAHASNKLILIATISNPRKNASDHAYGEAEIRNDTAGAQVVRFSNGFAYTGADPQTHDIGTLSITYLYTPGNTTNNTYKVRIRNIHSTGNVGWSMNGSTSTFLAIELDYS
tara:strand:+ start:317 stop:934 length:618 start_codon:yes stop_codon:yes gene_type:complete